MDATDGVSPPKKSIGVFGSLALFINASAGPAMMGLPKVIQEAGFLPVTFLLLMFAVFSSLCSVLFADSISMIPGNNSLQRRIQFSDAFNLYLGKVWFYVTQAAFFICLMSQNIAAIVTTSQTLDSFISSQIYGYSVAIAVSLSPNTPVFSVISWSGSSCEYAHDLKHCQPFDSLPPSTLVLSVGYLAALVLLLPLGLRSLDDNVIVQKFSCVLFFLLIVEFIYAMTLIPTTGTHYVIPPLVGTNWGSLIGVVLFNYSFINIIPAWLNEKSDDVNVNQVVWTSIASCTVVYIVFGIVAACAFDTRGLSDNVLTLLTSTQVDSFTQFAACLFGFIILGLDIPVVCVILSSNLYSGGLFKSRAAAVFVGSIFPWLISWILYSGNSVLDLIAWAGVIFNGFVVYLAPAFLSLWASFAVVYYYCEHSGSWSLMNPVSIVRGKIDVSCDDDSNPVFDAASKQLEIAQEIVDKETSDIDRLSQVNKNTSPERRHNHKNEKLSSYNSFWSQRCLLSCLCHIPMAIYLIVCQYCCCIFCWLTCCINISTIDMIAENEAEEWEYEVESSKLNSNSNNGYDSVNAGDEEEEAVDNLLIENRALIGQVSSDVFRRKFWLAAYLFIFNNCTNKRADPIATRPLEEQQNMSGIRRRSQSGDLVFLRKKRSVQSFVPSNSNDNLVVRILASESSLGLDLSNRRADDSGRVTAPLLSLEDENINIIFNRQDWWNLDWKAKYSVLHPLPYSDDTDDSCNDVDSGILVENLPYSRWKRKMLFVNPFLNIERWRREILGFLLMVFSLFVAAALVLLIVGSDDASRNK